MAGHSQKWHDGSSSRSIEGSSFEGIATIVNKLENLGRDMKKLKENVHAIQVGCQKCKGAHLDKDCPLKEEYFVTVGAVQGNPGRETLDNWLKIEKTEDGYQFVWCPTVCNFCKVLCRDVGIFVDDHGNRRLALSDVPYSVHFYR
ncbi:Kunitz trypsin inhibitor 2-like protein [Tanacetum coccineum]